MFHSTDRSPGGLAFESLALVACGLVLVEFARNYRLALDAQKRWKTLAETSPAAILTTNERGLIELANPAATELMAPRDGNLIGAPIAAFLPQLHQVLHRENGEKEIPNLRAAMQCKGHRGNGEPFTADVWYSTHREGPAPRLNAIIADRMLQKRSSAASNASHPESHDPASLNNREMDVLRFFVQGLTNREIATRMKISVETVKYTIEELFAKTKVRTRAQLVRVAIEHCRVML